MNHIAFNGDFVCNMRSRSGGYCIMRCTYAAARTGKEIPMMSPRIREANVRLAPQQSRFSGQTLWRAISGIALLVALLAAPMGTARAQAGPSWNSIGPAGGTVSALLSSPGSSATLYAGTPENGVFVSTDAGATWNAANAGLPASASGRQQLYTVYSLATDGHFVYAATGAGVFYTVDGAAPNWTALAAPTPAPSTPITLLAFDPGTSRLFAAAGTSDAMANPAATPGIYVTSIDTSAAPAPAWSFSTLPTPLGATIDAVALVPAQPATSTPAAVMASTGGLLYRASVLPASLDLSWTNGDPNGLLPTSSALTALTFSTDSQTAYVCNGGAAFYSGNPLDAMPVWLAATVPTSGTVPFDCHAFITVPNAVLLAAEAGVFISTDGGASFQSTAQPGPSLWANALAIGTAPGAAASTLFVGTGFGVASTSLASLTANVAWSPSNGPAALAAGGANLRLNNAHIVDTAVLGTTLYAAAVGNEYDEVFASTDGGATWSGTNLGSALLPSDEVISLLPDAGHGTLFAATSQGLLAYSPSSARWSAVAAAAIPGRAGALALGATALFVGTDNGLWSIPLSTTPATAVPVAAGLTGSIVRALLVAGGSVYVATTDANDGNFVFSASEASATAGTAVWSAYATGSAGLNSITALLPVGGGLLASTNGNLLLFATPGSGWASANTSMDPTQQISDPFGIVKGLYSDGVSIYAATGSNGVFVSPFSTAFAWTPFSGSGSTALPSMQVHTLRASGTTLYAATRAGVASFSGIVGSGGGTPPPPPPPPPSSDSGGGALDPWSDLFLFGAVLAMVGLRLQQRRLARVRAGVRRRQR
jgi:hypothetical protein